MNVPFQVGSTPEVDFDQNQVSYLELVYGSPEIILLCWWSVFRLELCTPASTRGQRVNLGEQTSTRVPGTWFELV